MQFYIFSFRGIPVHLSVWALVLIGWLAFRGGDPLSGAMTGVGVLLSILIHEFGHALVAARYGLQPSVMLHALGGTTSHVSAKTDGQEALIVAAGPALQLVASGVALVLWTTLGMVAPEVAGNAYLSAFLWAFLYVGIFWAFINVLPMWPMDGGKLYRLGLVHLLKVKPAMADRVTYITGIVFAALMIIVFWLIIKIFGFLALFIFGLIIFQNVQGLRSQQAAGPVRRQNRHAKALLEEAREAFANRRYGEAARLGHQIRTEPEIPESMLGEVFELIALGHILDGKLEEGVRFARRAPPKPGVIAARIKALVALDRSAEARTVLREHGDVLPSEVRRELEQQTA